MKTFLSLSLTLPLAMLGHAICNGSFTLFPLAKKNLRANYYLGFEGGDIAVGYTYDCITGTIGSSGCSNAGSQWGTLWDSNCNILAINLDGLCGSGYGGGTDVGCDANGNPTLVVYNNLISGNCYRASGDCGEGLGTGTHLWSCCPPE